MRVNAHLRSRKGPDRDTSVASAIIIALDEVRHSHKHGTAIRLEVASIEFDTSGPLDAGSALLERLDAALLGGWKVGFEKFERQSADAATNTLAPVVHVEVDNVGREVVVTRIGCSCERHGRCSYLPTRSPAPIAVTTLLKLMAKKSRPCAVPV